MLFTGLGWSVCLDHYPRPQAQFFPIQTSHLMNHTHTHIYIYFVHMKSFRIKLTFNAITVYAQHN